MVLIGRRIPFSAGGKRVESLYNRYSPRMEGSAERAFLEQLEQRLVSGEPVEAEVSLDAARRTGRARRRGRAPRSSAAAPSSSSRSAEIPVATSIRRGAPWPRSPTISTSRAGERRSRTGLASLRSLVTDLPELTRAPGRPLGRRRSRVALVRLHAARRGARRGIAAESPDRGQVGLCSATFRRCRRAYGPATFLRQGSCCATELPFRSPSWPPLVAPCDRIRVAERSPATRRTCTSRSTATTSRSSPTAPRGGSTTRSPGARSTRAPRGAA